MGKKCDNCGAPQNNSLSDSCEFCGNKLMEVAGNEEINRDFLLIRYEFMQGNYKKVSSLSEEYVRKDIYNIPAWAYKLVAGAFVKDRFDFKRFKSSFQSVLSLGLFKETNSEFLESLLRMSIQNMADMGYTIDSIENLDEFLEFSKAQFSSTFTEWLKKYKVSLSNNIEWDLDLNEKDALFDDAAQLIVQSQIGSTSLLQRRMKLGYNRAGRLMDQLEAAGIVGPSLGAKAREVLIKTDYDLNLYLKTLYW